jgi:hypothetical protein
MTLIADDVELWRRRAEELRATAIRLTDLEAKELFLEFADEYDKMADRTAQRAHFLEQ